MSNLEKIGWNTSIQIENKDKVARVIEVQKNSYKVSDGKMEFFAHLSGKFLNQAIGSLDFPAVGDWVDVQKLIDEKKAVINGVFPRQSQFVRQAAGTKTEAQIVAANLDVVFIVNSLNHDLNLRRIERYILSTYESGAIPVVVLTKRDECLPAEVEAVIAKVEEVAIGIPIIAVSSITMEGIEALLEHLPRGKTAALLGSSGVGKSTLVNTLMGNTVQDTKDVRESDSKGRHITTHREMFVLPNGALLVDTPGMRELQLWEGEAAIETAFQDVEAYENECRFNDCKHVAEPGCRVQEALTSGELSAERFQSYLKLQREIAYEKRKQDQKAKLEEKNKWKKLTKAQHNHYAFRKKG